MDIQEDKKTEGAFATAEGLAQYIKDHLSEKSELMDLDEKMHFSYDLEASLTEAEREADKKLHEMTRVINDPMTQDKTTLNFFEYKDELQESLLFKTLNAMPKGAIHHIHTTAANPIDAYLKLTYDDRVYFNNRERLFKVFPKHKGVPNGYLQCTAMRSFAKDPEEFD